MRGKYYFLPHYYGWIIAVGCAVMLGMIVALSRFLSFPSGIVPLAKVLFIPFSSASLWISWFHVFRKTFGTYEEKSFWFLLILANLIMCAVLTALFWSSWYWYVLFPLAILVGQVIVFGKLVAR